LRRSEERYRFLFERSPAVNLMIGADGRIRDVTKSVAERLGYSNDEILGKKALGFVVAEQREKVAAVLEMAFQGEDTPEMDVDVYAKDGSVRTVFFSQGQVLLKEEGQPISVLFTGVDITERKESEEALRASELKYRALFQDIPHGVYQSSPDGKLLTANPALVHMLGYDSEAELLAANITRDIYANPEDRSTWMRKLEEDGELHDIEALFKRKDGRLLTVLDSGHVVRDEQGRVLYYEGTLTDITERKRMEQELRRYSTNLEQLVAERTGKLAESERRFRELADLLPQIVFEIDEQGNLLFANRITFAATGYAEDDLRRGLNAFQMFAPEDHDRARQTMQRILSGEKSRGDEYTVQRKDGSTFPAVVDAAPIMRENKPVGLRGVVIDITKRKRMEDELRATGDRLQFLLSSSPAMIYTAKAYGDCRTTFVSENFKDMLGYDSRELLEVPNFWVNHIHPEDRTRTLEAERRVLKEGCGNYEYRFQHKDGTYRWMREEARLVRDATGNPLETIGYWIDITDQKHAEEELLESEERFRGIAERSFDSIFIMDEEGRITYASPAGERLFGYTSEEGLGKSSQEFIPGSQIPKLAQVFAELRKGKPVAGLEIEMRRKDGSLASVEVNASPILREGHFAGLQGIARDITERKRAEEELRSARERLEHVITSNPAALITGKPRADLSDYDVTYMSDRVVEMLGFEPQQFIGHPEFWDGRVHPDDLRRYLTEVPELWKKGQRTFECRFLHKDGTYHWIREEAKVIRDADGKPTEVNGYWTDVTERKRLEEELAKSQRLATIGELAAMVGHDLRNPLTGITGAAYYLKKKDGSGLSEGGKEMLQLIQEDIRRSDKIINDLVEYSKEPHLEPSQTNMKLTTEDALAEVKFPKGIRVVNSTKKQPAMMLDTDKMRRVFVNIIQNAVDAMPNGGTLTIASTRSGDNVRITFRDTGEGMTEKTLAKLWSPLFTTKAKGMGFGLPIAKRLVEEHGGSIAVESKPSKGSTFTLKLPLVQKEVKSKK